MHVNLRAFLELALRAFLRWITGRNRWRIRGLIQGLIQTVKVGLELKVAETEDID